MTLLIQRLPGAVLSKHFPCPDSDPPRHRLAQRFQTFPFKVPLAALIGVSAALHDLTFEKRLAALDSNRRRQFKVLTFVESQLRQQSVDRVASCRWTASPDDLHAAPEQCGMLLRGPGDRRCLALDQRELSGPEQLPLYRPRR